MRSRAEVLVATVSVVVIVGSVSLLVASSCGRRTRAVVLEHLWECSACGHEFRRVMPKETVPPERRQVKLAELLGGKVTCPQCGGVAWCRARVRCRRCGATCVATIAWEGETGRPVPFRCINAGCARPLLVARPVAVGEETKGERFRCEGCGRTFAVVALGKARKDDLQCPFSDHAPTAVGAAE